MSIETAGLLFLLLALIAIFGYLILTKGYSLLQNLNKRHNDYLNDKLEGFENSKGKVKTIDNTKEFFDNFYLERIDQAYYPESKNLCRCSDLYKSAYLRIYPNNKTRTLLVGTNTGRYLDALTGICPEVTGITQYPELKDMASRMAPKAKVLLGDAARDDELFDKSTFTHVIFEDRSLYEFIDHNERKKALENVINWLEPGGRLILRVVDREKFDPMVPTSVPIRGLNIQNYLNKRKQDSRVYFKDGSLIDTNFTSIPSEDRAVFREDLYDKNNTLLRTQIHRWAIPNRDAIIDEVSRFGLEHDQSLSLAPCTSPHETYEIFIKKEHISVLGLDE